MLICNQWQRYRLIAQRPFQHPDDVTEVDGMDFAKTATLLDHLSLVLAPTKGPGHAVLLASKRPQELFEKVQEGATLAQSPLLCYSHRYSHRCSHSRQLS